MSLESVNECVKVELNGKTFITRELTATQDQALASLFIGIDISPIWALFQPQEGDQALVTLEQELITTILKLLGEENRLVRFLSIILVPEEAGVYRQAIAKEFIDYFGDIPNSTIKRIVTDFFGRNGLSASNIASSLARVAASTELKSSKSPTGENQSGELEMNTPD